MLPLNQISAACKPRLGHTRSALWDRETPKWPRMAPRAAYSTKYATGGKTCLARPSFRRSKWCSDLRIQRWLSALQRAGGLADATCQRPSESRTIPRRLSTSTSAPRCRGLMLRAVRGTRGGWRGDAATAYEVGPAEAARVRSTTIGMLVGICHEHPGAWLLILEQSG